MMLFLTNVQHPSTSIIVDRICNNIMNCITNASPNNDSSPSTSHRRKPRWSTSTQHVKSLRSLWYVSGCHVISHDPVMYI